MTNEFVKRKGMSYLLTKRVADCTADEKEYKRAYARHVKQCYIAKKTQVKYHEYNSTYGKQYYELHKEELLEKARQQKALKRGLADPSKNPSLETRGRKNMSGITAS